MIKAITFDFWNTLYKAPADRRVFIKRMTYITELLHDAGHDILFETVVDVFKEAWNKADYMQRTYGRDPGPWGQIDFALQYLNLIIDENIKQQLYEAFIGTLLEIPPDVNDEVAETLPLLAEKYRLAVICNSGVTPGITLRKLLKKDGIFDYFQFVVFSDEVGWSKPNSAIFHYTLENIKVNYEEAAHIGDDEITDVAGAKKAGMTAVWLAPGKSFILPEADYQVESVKELLYIF